MGGERSAPAASKSQGAVATKNAATTKGAEKAELQGEESAETADAAEGGDDDVQSKALMMEELKLMTQRLSQMMQALSAVLNTSHENAMNTMRNIK